MTTYNSARSTERRVTVSATVEEMEIAARVCKAMAEAIGDLDTERAHWCRQVEAMARSMRLGKAPEENDR